MFKRLRRGWRHSLTILRALPRTANRKLLGQMISLSRALPAQFNRPLPQMMARLTPPPRAHPGLPLAEIRHLADAVAAWHWRSPLGICLRRSLLRYYFLRQAGLEVAIVFGARFKDAQEGGGIGGHAWLALNGQPYYENPNDYQGFVKMYVYPDSENPT